MKHSPKKPAVANTQKQLKTTLLASIFLLLSPINSSAETVTLVHNSGLKIQGDYIANKKELVTAPISTVEWFAVKTENCGQLKFQASIYGMVCRNCAIQVERLTSCELPKQFIGWKIAD